MTAMPKRRTMRARSQYGLDLARRPAAVQLEAERLTHDDRVRLALAHHEEVGVALRFDREDLAAAPREVGARQCKEAQGLSTQVLQERNFGSRLPLIVLYCVCAAASGACSDLAELAEAYKRTGCPCSVKPDVPSVTPSEFAAAVAEGKHILLDVRRSIHSDIVTLPTAIHLPLKQLCCESGVDAVRAAASCGGERVLDV